MIIYPAIDLRGGQVVRLKEGDPDQQTIFSADPLATAQMWQDKGAQWLHMVNLDGAFDDENNHLEVLRQVAQLGIKVQFGGGLRDMPSITAAINAGASRVVLGTIAAKQPEVVVEAIEQFGAEAVCVAMDARNGKVTTHGWTEATNMTPIELGQAMANNGVRHALYTDVNRDGSLEGVNIDDTIGLAEATGLAVIASGGVSTLNEIRELAASGIVAGAVIGMALYRQEMTLEDALSAAKEQL